MAETLKETTTTTTVAPTGATPILGENEQTREEILENARDDAMANHRAGLAQQPKKD